ncbi:MAG: nucleoside hydrolase [Bacteroidota bacterium]|nr:nucleoside hydrolase [Bacteroidota bacterium]
MNKQPKRIWMDTDIMIGLPVRAPREVDDGVTLIMALRQPSIELAGISLITEIDYAEEVTLKLLNWYNKTGKDIPVYKGSNEANDVGEENDATKALAAALEKEKLFILAIGPATNIATVLKNRPELASQIEEIAFCVGRTEGLEFRPGLGNYAVADYNFDRDVESFQIILDTDVPLVFSGFECSYDVFLGPIDIDRLSEGTEGDKWVYDQLMPWIRRGHSLFGSEGFIPYDTTVLGYFTHPEQFKYYDDIPVQINEKPNDAPMNGRDPRLVKPYLEVSYDFSSTRKVKYAYQTLPGFEEIVIKSLLGR